MTREEAIKTLKSKMDGHTDTSYKWAETVRMAIEALEKEPKWIPVKERLPEIQDGKSLSDPVWSCSKYGDGYMWQSVDQCTSDGKWLSEVPFDDPRERCKVVAWMPLPEPYEEGAVG